MGLAQFIAANIEAILTDWESFARSLPPGQGMSSGALRNDAAEMLLFIAADMATAQSEPERAVKGRGQKPVIGGDSAAHDHGRLRLTQAFDLAQMVSEFRALRASVTRLWSAHLGEELPSSTSELIRFNEAIDQVLAESMQRYASDLDRARELLLAVLSHDLRNPLSAIRMSAEVLAKTTLTSRQNELTEGIIRGSERMRRMIHDLLDFTRTRLGATLVVNAERCDLAKVCRSIAAETRSAHPDRDVTVESSGDCVGQWDCARTAQLVANLVGNAIQHGHANTPVQITTSGDHPAEVSMTVGNHGPPIPPKHHHSIFNPLNRGPIATEHREGGSLGLGLYIAREIALAHGGNITLLSSTTAGTFFEVRLPRVGATLPVSTAN